jgi:hypothetical protein
MTSRLDYRNRERLATEMRDRRRKLRIACLGAAVLSVVANQATAQGPVRRGDSADAPSRPYHLNFNRIEIPFSVDQVGQPPVEVQLYVSRDAGLQWELVTSQAVSGKPFLFEAPADGDYWLATRTVDARGNAAPLRPQMSVRVDTAKPQADLQVSVTSNGAVAATLLCSDEAISAESIRVEYSVDQSRQWTLVTDIVGSTAASDTGRLQVSAEIVPPEPWHQISVRASVDDLAGNNTIVTRQIDKPRIAAGQMRLATSKASSNGSSPSPSPSPSTALSPTRSPQPVPPAVATAPPDASAVPSYARQPDARVATHSPWAVPQFSVSSGLVAPDPPSSIPPSFPVSGMSGPELTGPLTTSTPTPAPAPQIAAPPPELPRPRTAAEAMRPLSTQGTTGSATVSPNTSSPNAASPSPVRTMMPPQQATVPTSQGSASDPSTTAAPPAYTTPPTYNAATSSPAAVPNPMSAADYATALNVPTRYSRSRKFSLEYDIESTGLAGVSDVELWGTIDRGATWKRWGADPDRESPFDIETNNDGTYGFRIVVVASNGLATPPPLPGETADIQVVVDSVAPQVRITGASYGEADQTGSLVIRY